VEVGSSLGEVAQQKWVPGISLDGCDGEGSCGPCQLESRARSAATLPRSCGSSRGP
jgi:hypothetical protein